MKKNGKMMAAIIGIIVVAVIAGFFACSNRTEVRVRKQLALGQKYLEEMNYEQAVVAFELALEIEPMSVEAYLGLVEVYIRTGDFEIALEYATKGYEVTKDERLKEKINMIESGNIFAENGWIMKESDYEGDGSLNGYFTYTYRLDGKIKTVTAYHGDGRFSGEIAYQYDEEGRGIVERWESDGDDGELNMFKAEHERNEEGKVIRTNVYNNDGKLSHCEEYEYDADGKLTIIRDYYDGVLSEYEEHQYDSDGKEIRVDYYFVNGNSVGDGETHYYQEHECDAEGKVIRINTYKDNGELDWYEEKEYNSVGKEVASKCYDADGTLLSYWEAE